LLLNTHLYILVLKAKC